MHDKFEDFQDSLHSPPAHAQTVVPDDAADLPHACRCLNVAADGFVRLTTVRGDVVTLSVYAGTLFPIRARRIWATGTTASGIVALH